MSEILNMSRREFLKTGTVMGGGLLLGLYVPFSKRSQEALAAENGAPYPPNAFLRISPDNTVTIIIGKSEMGQSVYTSLPMLVAEELECDWSKVKVEFAPVAPVYNNPVTGIQMTGGSMSVRTEWERMRKVGAAARDMLITAAAAMWKVDRASCRAENGKVVQTDGKALTYGELANRAAELPVPEKVTLKDPSTFKIIGNPTHRLDTPQKVKGKAIFGLDATAPGMAIALVARPPVFGGRVKRVSRDKAKAVAGVREVVEISSGIAVVADSFWSAKKGRDALDIVWDEGPLATLSTEAMRKQYADKAKTPGLTARKDGDPEMAVATALTKVNAEYEVPYLAHATMEPLNCLVDLSKDRCEIWTGTQFQTVDRENAAKVAGLKPEQVKIHTTFLGGGFGRRANPHSDFVVMAVETAKAVRRPVKVIWTRADDMKGGYYRPLWYSRLAAGIDGKGNLTAWHHTLVGQSIIAGTPFAKTMLKNGIDPTSVEGAADIPYEIPNILVDLHTPEIGVPVQWWRSVGHSHTGFAVESFVDEVAHAAGKDPYEFRRDLLAKHPRHRGVLDLVAEKAGWGLPLPAGRFQGIAVHKSFES
jgi:isoquinoline 1-oxidoreductase beta subunit